MSVTIDCDFATVTVRGSSVSIFCGAGLYDGAPTFTQCRACKHYASQGLGDTVEKVTRATGVARAADFISRKTGGDCGCKKRKTDLNKRFPYGEK